MAEHVVVAVVMKKFLCRGKKNYIILFSILSKVNIGGSVNLIIK